MATHPELETPRLTLRRFELADAPFLVDLLNQPSFIQNIGDRGVRTPEDARRYLQQGPLAMYERHGLGLWLLSRRDDDRPMGMCGLLRRESLPDVDLGYALLPQFWGRGYAHEAARATLEQGWRRLGLMRVLGVVSPHNKPSIHVLEKLGMRPEGEVCLDPGEPAVRLYAIHRPEELPAGFAT